MRISEILKKKDGEEEEEKKKQPPAPLSITPRVDQNKNEEPENLPQSPFEKGGERGILEKQSNPPVPFAKGGIDNEADSQPARHNIFAREKTDQVKPEKDEGGQKHFALTEPCGTKSIEETALKDTEAENLYNDAIVFVKLLFSRLSGLDRVDYNELEALVKKIVRSVEENNPKLTGLTLEETPKNYLIAHSVNVCILAVKMARSYGIGRQTLENIGLGAILHDLGMAGYMDLLSTQGILTEAQKKTIREHCKATYDLIMKFTDIQADRKKIIADIAYSVHERRTGKGYPTGKKDILIESQLIGIVDIFEAMTHRRPYRDKLPPFKAIENIIKEEQGSFEPKIYKILIEELSIYPIGSIVRLDNNLIAEVIGTNRNSPVRPVVRVIFNNTDISATNMEDLRLVKGTVIDLCKNSMFYIKEGIEKWEGNK